MFWKSDVVWDKGGKSREEVMKLLASISAKEILEKLKQVEKTKQNKKKQVMRCTSLRSFLIAIHEEAVK